MRHIKHFLAILLVLCSTVASAHDFEVGGIYYNITDATAQTVEVTYSSVANEYTGAVTIPSTVTYNGTTYSVTSIGNYAFAYDNLTRVTIGNSVTSIGESAFYHCDDLTRVTIGNSVTSIGKSAFNGCTFLRDITIPSSVTSIGEDAFAYCIYLSDIEIPNSVTSIGEDAFYDCTLLSEVHINDLASWCRIDFSSIYSNPLFYAHNLYLNGEKVTDLVIPDGVTEIKGDAFYSCSGLKSVIIGNSVTSIGGSAFDGCNGLTSVTIGYSVTSIGYHAFYSCSGLKTVYNLSSLPLVKGSTDYGHVAFYADYLINTSNGSVEGDFIFDVVDGVNTLCGYVGNGGDITLPADYNGASYAIGANAFRGRSGLTSIEIPNSVTSIGKSAFAYCTGLRSVVIPSSVTSIGEWAFYGCSDLKFVTIGNGVTRIGDNAFYGCTGLKSVYNNSSLNIFKGREDYGYVAYYADRVLNHPYFSVEGNFIFGVIDDVIILLEYIGNGGDITLPTNYKGYNYVIGSYAFSNCTGLTGVTIPNGVTGIGDYAFRGCTGLTGIEIPNSVTSIGESAFNGCTGLTGIEIPNSVTSIGESAFNGCTGLVSVTINSECIGEGMFSGCTGLTSIEIPNSVTSIGGSAFSGCTGLVSVTINSESIGEGMFSGCTGLTSIEIPNSVTSIGGSAFSGCTGLVSVTINSESIGEGMFSGCTKLADVTIGNNVTSIGRSAFSGCSKLANVTIPNSVESIGESAFYGCTGLTSVTIGNSVTGIGDNAFYGCTGLKTVYNLSSLPLGRGNSSDYGHVIYYANYLINAPNGSFEGDFVFGIKDGVKTLCGYIGNGGDITLPADYNGENYVIGSSVFRLCTGLTSITIPNSVTSIGDEAFYYCTDLKSVTIPNSVTSIGDDAFYECWGLTSVHISDLSAWCKIDFGDASSNPLYYAHNLYLNGEKVTDLVIPSDITGIKNYTFYGCSGLTSVTIGNSVTSIGSRAFDGCSGLTSVHISDLSAWCKIDFGNYSSNPLYYAHNLYLNGEQVTGLVIPSDITEIKQYAFEDCSGLTSIIIPNSVESIGNEAFDGCSGLIKVTIGNSVTGIGDNAFRDCGGLKTVYNLSSLPLEKGSNNYGLVAYYANVVFNNISIEGDFLFAVVDGVNTLIEYIGNGGDITLPADYNGENYVIAANAFYGRSGLTGVTIPNSVTSIGGSAFYGCSGLTGVTIPNSVTSIGGSAFYGCSGLTDITIGNSVTSIGSYAFYGCTGLTSVHISDLSAWCKIDFNDYYSNPLYYATNLYLNGEQVTDLVIPSDITEIKNYTFYGCSGLTSVTIGNSVTSIGGSAFYGCTGLTSVTIGNGVTVIGDIAFSGCTKLADVTIGNNVTSIGRSAFSDCTGLTSIEIPNSVTSIGDYAFNGCDGLTDITIGNSVTSIGGSAFYRCFNLKTVYNFSSLPLVKGSTDYGYVAFYADYLINTPNGSVEGDFIFDVVDGVNTLCGYVGNGGDITLPADYNGENYVIGANAFYGCTSLTGVVISSGVTSIGSYAFYGCTGLANVFIQSGVNYIGINAFYNCTNLKIVYNSSSLNIVKGSEDFGYVAYYADKVINASNGFIEGDFVFARIKVPPLQFTTADGLPGTVTGSNHIWESPVINSSTNGVRITVLATNGGSNMYNYNGYPIVALGELEFYDGNGNKINYTASNVTTNSLEGSEGSLAALCDGDYSTFYHSTWSGNGTTPADYVYLDVEFPQTVDKFKIKMVGRNTKSLVPTEINVASTGGIIINNYSLVDYIGNATALYLPENCNGNNYTIGADAFRDNTAITSIVIPNSVTSIGNDAFYGCENLKTVTNNSSLNIVAGSTDNGYVAYYADKVINAPNGSVEGDFVFGIKDGVNTLCGYIGNGGDITLPENYNGENYVIGDSVFYKNTAITGVTIPNSVTSIGSYAFSDCTRLTSVTIPNSVTSIGWCAFYKCSGLTSVTIGNSVESIGESAFYGCSGLTSVHISDLSAWCKIDFNDYYSNPLYYATNLYLNGEQVTDLVIPSDITEIKNYTFYGCTGLTGVTIGNSVTSIGGSAFYGCSGLTSIEIPNSVTSIGDYAFRGCTGLTSIEIPNSVTSIGNDAFYRCENLKTVYNCSSLNIVAGSIYNGYVAYYADKVINAPNSSIEGDFVFGIIDGVNTLVEYIGDGGDITLPENYNGENYVIGDSVFYKNTAITGVTIPAGVTSIGDNAFYGCENLKTVTNNSSLNIVLGSTDNGYVAYYADKVINADGSSTSIIGDYKFTSANGVNTLVEYLGNGGDITLPENYNGENYVIGADVFQDNTAITGITIPAGVTAIGDNAFYGCENLKTVTNNSSLNIVAGSTDNGYVAYYADKVINADGSSTSIIGDYKFTSYNGVNTLVEYLGDGGDITLPENYNGENYVIGSSVFRDNTAITGVTIPAGVTAIGDNAFYGCENLKTVTNNSSLNIVLGSTDNGYVAYYADYLINTPNGSVGGDFIFGVVDGVNTLIEYTGNGGDITLPADYNGENYVIAANAFRGCSGLTSIEIPNSVTSIGGHAFHDCSGLTSVTIGNSVTSIGFYAFYGCSGLTSVHINDLAAWCRIDFGSDYYSNPLYYARNLYLNGEQVTDLVIPSDITEIKNYTFYGCWGLTSIVIPNSVTSIGKSAFEDCWGLTSIEIPNSVTSIGDSAFRGCSGLTSIEIPNSVTSIGGSAFSGCTGLTSIEIPNSVTSIGESAFYYCTGLTSITVNSGNSIYDSREGCNAIIETATNTLIAGCKNTIIPNSVTSIGGYAFNGCWGLTSIEIPNSVTSIGDYAFAWCTALASVTSNAVIAPTLGANVFGGIAEGATLTYPQGSDYSSWSDYFTISLFTPGDINGDSEVNVGDFASLVNLIFNSDNIDAATMAVADINSDGEVNVGDFAGLVNLIFNSGSQAAPKRAAALATTVEPSLYIEPFSIAPGEQKQIEVLLDNPGEKFSQLQFDLALPEGVEIVFDEDNFCYTIDRGSRLASVYNIDAQDVNGGVKVLALTTNPKAYIKGESGDVVLITVQAADDIADGVYDLSINNVVLSHQDGSTVKASSTTAAITVSSTTGITNIEGAEGSDVYYDLQGRKVAEPVKGGIYIVNNKKVVVNR